MLARPCAVVLGLCLLGVAGCGPGKLDETKTWAMESGDARAVDLPAQSKAQTITVDFESSAGTVGVYVFKEADAKGEDGLVAADPAKAIASKKGEKAGSFTADIPENTAARVVVRGVTEKTNVKLHVTNQKK